MQRLPIICIILLMFQIPIHAQDTCADSFAQASQLSVGDTAQVTPGDANNVRSEPVTQAIVVGRIPGGSTVTVVSTAVCDEDYSWIKVEFGDIIGWTVEATADEYWIVPVEGTPYEDDFVNFVYPSEIADAIDLEFSPGFNSMGGPFPIHQQYFLIADDDSDENMRFLRRMMLIPVEEMSDDFWYADEELQRLLEIVEENPDVSDLQSEAIGFTVLPPESRIPSDPAMIGARRIIIVAPHMVDMQNGRGVAFVTMYAQDAIPIINQVIFYNFVGITSDDKYLVSIRLPIRSNILPDTYEDVRIPDNWDETFPTYYAETTAKLNALTPDGWEQSMDILDSFINTIEVLGGFEDN